MPPPNNTPSSASNLGNQSRASPRFWRSKAQRFGTNDPPKESGQWLKYTEPPWCMMASETEEFFHIARNWVPVAIESAHAHSKNTSPGTPNQKARERKSLKRAACEFTPSTRSPREAPPAAARSRSPRARSIPQAPCIPPPRSRPRTEGGDRPLLAAGRTRRAAGPSATGW